MYVVGGSFRGRMMADTHELDLVDLTWRRLATPAGSERALPACAGHRAATIGETTYVVGGRYKGSSESEMAVYRMERMDVHEGVDEVEWIRVETTGEEMPRARRGASVTAFGDRELVVFGGEDDEGRLERRGRRGMEPNDGKQFFWSPTLVQLVLAKTKSTMSKGIFLQFSKTHKTGPVTAQFKRIL